MFLKYLMMNLLRRVRQSLSTSSDNTKHILLLSSLRPGSGNAATALRIAHELETSTKFIVNCVSIDTPHTESYSLLTYIRQYAAVVALHVYQAGNLLSTIYKDGENDLPPLILIFTGTELHSCESKWISTMEYIIPRANGLVCFNNEWKKYVETTYKNYLSCKITVIPQSVLLSSFIFEQLPLYTDKKIIIWVGEIHSVKDPIFAIRFLSHLNNNDYHLFLVGYENDQILNEYIRSSYSQLNLTFLGGQSQSFVHTLMRTSFAYINTSINEGMCLTILEAMTLGIPVLARRNTGNKSIIKHEKTGFLFDTPDEAVQYLIELDNNTKLRYLLIQQAENYVRKHHNITNETKSYRKLLLDLVK
jgi:glycosyltransferase involved in cell wall biosynthesis